MTKYTKMWESLRSQLGSAGSLASGLTEVIMRNRHPLSAAPARPQWIYNMHYPQSGPKRSPRPRSVLNFTHPPHPHPSSLQIQQQMQSVEGIVRASRSFLA